MLKHFSLLLLVTVGANLSGMRHRHQPIVYSLIGMEIMLRDPDKVILFEAFDRLLSALPGVELLDVNCNCHDRGEFTAVKMHKISSSEGDYLVSMPWAVGVMGSTSDRGLNKYYASICRAGLTCELETFIGEPNGIKITALDGQGLPKKNLSAEERCSMLAAWRKFREEKQASTTPRK